MNVGKIARNVYQHPIEAKLKHNKLQIILVSSSLVQPRNIVLIQAAIIIIFKILIMVRYV